MDLFQIERFSFENSTAEHSGDSKNEQRRLEALQEKIRKNKAIKKIARDSGGLSSLNPYQKNLDKDFINSRDLHSLSQPLDATENRKSKHDSSVESSITLVHNNRITVENTPKPTKDRGKKKTRKVQSKSDTPAKNSVDLELTLKDNENEHSCEGPNEDEKLVEKLEQVERSFDTEAQDETMQITEVIKTEEEQLVSGDTSYYKILGKQKPNNKRLPVSRSLPKWLKEPILICGDVSTQNIPLEKVDYLKDSLKKKLESGGISHLFPVQTAVTPFILSQVMKDSIYTKGGIPPRDVCVAAPTGSGKTLSYVLPITQILMCCSYRRLQCLVIAPTKELASQIKKVFNSLTHNTNLHVGLASGQNTFKSEQESLVCKSYDKYYSNVDILVSTPGRLVDHLLQTPGFSLKDLRFLVIDEADRLLGQEYSNWGDRIIEEVYEKDQSNSRFKDTVPCAASFLIPKLPFQKLLFSATLTQNPEKLAPLRLHRPVLFAAKAASAQIDLSDTKPGISIDNDKMQRYVLPQELQQKMFVTRDTLKPLIILYLMTQENYRGVLCFTKSKESTHRLFLLAKAFGGIKAAEFSADLTHPQRKGVIRDFIAGKIDLLISTDAMARGIDIENVKVVISYDPPANIKTYIHRVGRTARAGQKGTAIILLLKKEVYYFHQLLHKIGQKGLSKLGLKLKDLEPLTTQYEEALKSLSDMVHDERQIPVGQKRKRSGHDHSTCVPMKMASPL